jgi:hypothetical protein
MKRLAVGIAIGLVLAGTAVAVASIPDSAGVIHGCRNLKSGALRVIDTDAGQSCSKDEAALTWNQTGPQGPAGPPGPGPSVVNVVRRYDTGSSGLSQGYGHHIETVPCPTGKHVINGGVSTWAPDDSLPADGYHGAAYDASADQGWSLEAEGALPRPVDGNTGWRLTTWVSLPSDSGVNPPVFYPIDVTYFVVCA